MLKRAQLSTANIAQPVGEKLGVGLKKVFNSLFKMREVRYSMTVPYHNSSWSALAVLGIVPHVVIWLILYGGRK